MEPIKEDEDKRNHKGKPSEEDQRNMKETESEAQPPSLSIDQRNTKETESEAQPLSLSLDQRKIETKGKQKGNQSTEDGESSAKRGVKIGGLLLNEVSCINGVKWGKQKKRSRKIKNSREMASFKKKDQSSSERNDKHLLIKEGKSPINDGSSFGSNIRTKDQSASDVKWGKQKKHGRKIQTSREMASFNTKEQSASERNDKRLLIKEGKRSINDGSSFGSNIRTTEKAGRWLTERYKSAMKALHGVLQKLDATWHNRVNREDLRNEAKKFIRDTGLLDNLLAIKNSDGLLFSDGDEGPERLVREFNSKGVPEYWLEPAVMKDIRQLEGVDEYWIPTDKNWKVGDPIPSTDSLQREIDELKSEITDMRNQLNLVSNKLKEVKAELSVYKDDEERRFQFASSLIDRWEAIHGLDFQAIPGEDQRKIETKGKQKGNQSTVEGESSVKWGVKIGGLLLNEVSCLSNVKWGKQKKRADNGRKIKNSREMASFNTKEQSASERNDKRLLIKEGKRSINDGSSFGSNIRTTAKAGRWLTERYKSAMKALHGVLQKLDATWHNRVNREDLRNEAKKFIRDTGLVDNLLAIKNSDGILFSDGDEGPERLVRKFNSKGVPEYWLESAVMKDIRQLEGVDEYWIPTDKNWKVGDPIITTDKLQREIDELKSEMTDMRIQLNLVSNELKEKQEELTVYKNGEEAWLSELHPSSPIDWDSVYDFVYGAIPGEDILSSQIDWDSSQIDWDSDFDLILEAIPEEDTPLNNNEPEAIARVNSDGAQLSATDRSVNADALGPDTAANGGSFPSDSGGT